MGNHVIGVASVLRDASDSRGGLAGKEIAAAAGIAVAAMSAVPADAYALTGFPTDHLRADSVHDSNHFMPGNPWELDARKSSLLDRHIAVAYSARLDLDSNPS
jgi:hypothetical protein